VDHHLQTIAFPAISTGIYGYPFDQASGIAIQTVTDFLKKPGTIREVIFVLFGKQDYETFKVIFTTFEK
jgi:O-acetyl-ADP-ribose deacetylase (regulator of RNase III)